MGLTFQVASAAKAIAVANHRDATEQGSGPRPLRLCQSAREGFAHLAWDRPSLEAINITGKYVFVFQANLSQGTVLEASLVHEDALPNWGIVRLSIGGK